MLKCVVFHVKRTVVTVMTESHALSNVYQRKNLLFPLLSTTKRGPVSRREFRSNTMRSAADKGQLLAEMKNASLRLENDRAYSHLNTAELQKTTANTYQTLSGEHVKIRGNIRNIYTYIYPLSTLSSFSTEGTYSLCLELETPRYSLCCPCGNLCIWFKRS